MDGHADFGQNPEGLDEKVDYLTIKTGHTDIVKEERNRYINFILPGKTKERILNYAA